jgi:hypothetical protein
MPNTGFASGGLTCKLGGLRYQINLGNILMFCIP